MASFFIKFDYLNPKINFFFVIFITQFSETLNKTCLTSGEKVIPKSRKTYFSRKQTPLNSCVN